MKFLFLLWIAMESIFDASIWATAAWCVLYSFSNVLWLQCFWIAFALHLIGDLSFVRYIRTHTKEDCGSYIGRQSKLVGLSIISAPIISILPTIAVVILLTLLQVWTKLETHWLHTWLFVTCLVYSLLRVSEARKLALQANGQPRQKPRSIWRGWNIPGFRTGAKDVVEQPSREGWLDSRKPPGKVAGTRRKATNGSRSVRVIDI